MDAEKLIGRKWRLLTATMDERARRLWAGAEADALGWGGIARVARATGLAISTVTRAAGRYVRVPNPTTYGVYDVAANDAFVSVGTDHDTPVFAVISIEAWWMRMGAQRYPNARELFITADAGGSNGYRSRVWKAELQRLADKIGISIHISHFPPGTSKGNKIEHRLGCAGGSLRNTLSAA